MTGVTKYSTRHTEATEVGQGANCRVEYRVGLVSVTCKHEIKGVAAMVLIRVPYIIRV